MVCVRLAAGTGQGDPRQSTERNPRASVDSLGCESASTRSRRSSFALERASFDANRSSLEAFGRRDSTSSNRPSVELAQVCSHLHATLANNMILVLIT